MWDRDDKDGDEQSCHDQYLEEPEADVDGRSDALTWRHADRQDAHEQEKEAHGKRNL